jgi:hypothetical protein
MSFFTIPEQLAEYPRAYFFLLSFFSPPFLAATFFLPFSCDFFVVAFSSSLAFMSMLFTTFCSSIRKARRTLRCKRV